MDSIKRNGYKFKMVPRMLSHLSHIVICSYESFRIHLKENVVRRHRVFDSNFMSIRTTESKSPHFQSETESDSTSTQILCVSLKNPDRNHSQYFWTNSVKDRNEYHPRMVLAELLVGNKGIVLVYFHANWERLFIN